MSEVAMSDKSAASSGSLIRQGTTFCLSCLVLILPLGIALIAALPSMLWAYNIDRASRALEQGLVWPNPRRSDSLPQLRDDDALGRGLAHLAAAIHWRPTDAYAYRLAAQAYAAREEWLSAAQEAERASTLAPNNPLIAWERALVYEQLAEMVTSAPRENILSDLASVPINAPDQPIDTVYCRDGGPRTCYVDLDRYTQPYARMPDGTAITADVLFMHPPAGVALAKTIPAEAPALVFLMGLDPGTRNWNTDGATFQVWITPAAGRPIVAFEHTLDRATAIRGWVPGTVDLSSWAGQIVTLELRTHGGPAGNTTNDWYAWGNVAFTTNDAAQYALQLPSEQVVRNWQALGLDNRSFVSYGDEALRLKQYNHAVIWYDRGLHLEQRASFDVLYRRAIAAINSGNEREEAYLAAAQELDSSLEVAELTDQNASRIRGAALRWMTPIADRTTYGTALAAHPGPNVTTGYMWWRGEATTVVRAPRQARYDLTLRVEHSSPPPIELAIGVDGQQRGMFQLARGDASQELLSLPLHLEAGLHTINIWYINDGAAAGQDRNAAIEEIIIEEK